MYRTQTEIVASLLKTIHNAGLRRGYPTPWVVWKGEALVIEVSGLDIENQPLAQEWLGRHP
jgi:hypothetical protein